MVIANIYIVICTMRYSLSVHYPYLFPPYCGCAQPARKASKMTFYHQRWNKRQLQAIKWMSNRTQSHKEGKWQVKKDLKRVQGYGRGGGRGHRPFVCAEG